MWRRFEAQPPLSILRRMGLMASTLIPRAGSVRTAPAPTPVTDTLSETEGGWRVVVMDDPVNLMSYVVLVFKKVFGFDEAKARHHMLEVHERGRSVVWSGLREQAEHYVFVLQRWHLTAMLERDETG